MKHRGVIYDLDGTLIDSLRDIGDAANRVLETYHVAPFTTERYRTLVGDGVRVLFERAMAEREVAADATLIDGCMERFLSFYADNLTVYTEPYPGLIDVVQAVAAAGVPQAVLSNKPDLFTKRLAEHYFGGGTFSVVLGQREGVPKKPDPAGALEILESWGVPAGSVAYVGDTNTDMLTAAAAGCFAVGVAWGFRSKEELIRSGAACVVEDADALLRQLL